MFKYYYNILKIILISISTHQIKIYVNSKIIPLKNDDTVQILQSKFQYPIYNIPQSIPQCKHIFIMCSIISVCTCIQILFIKFTYNKHNHQIRIIQILLVFHHQNNITIKYLLSTYCQYSSIITPTFIIIQRIHYKKQINIVSNKFSGKVNKIYKQLIFKDQLIL
eukprot:TRINITY_DN1069_c1_g1_i3.p2 TRINITY_DN1069_c1_g1~~TRINITY_DN1069_c1_g1_i3.p2  ORF type:complete len:192 (+),score=-34.21 TRINITY_DN1069_c1_g1_i3:84-578(+)